MCVTTLADDFGVTSLRVKKSNRDGFENTISNRHPSHTLVSKVRDSSEFRLRISDPLRRTFFALFFIHD